MAKNSNLSKARTAKNDEFYTQMTDVEKELKHYKEHFKDKTILCNCDDPVHSAFWKYFHLNFNHLGLKKLISTHYLAQQFKWDLNAEKPYVMEYTGENDNDVNVGTKTYLKGDGDFRSAECIEFLKESDIVVTNPPFSLFREFVAVLMKYEKKFIIWGNNNAITYKEIFPLLKDDKMWTGYMSNATCVFELPDFYEKWDEKTTNEMNNGRKYGKVTAITVFTNLEINKRHEKLILYKTYNPEEYPKYDNYDAINVDKVADIPVDYKGVMGVPITFLDKYNPEQFEIIGLSSYIGCDDLYFFHKLPDNIQKQLIGGNAWMPVLHKNGTYSYSYRRLFVLYK